MQCQAQSLNKAILANVDRMEMICLEHGIVDGTQLLHSAYTMKSIMYIREEKIAEALEVLETTYQNQVKKLKNEPAHPFLE